MKRSLLLLPLALAIVACTPQKPATDTAAPTASAPATAPTTAPIAGGATLLGDHHWRLTEATNKNGERIGSLFVRADKPLTLNFANGRINVGNTCNVVAGSYSVENGHLKVGQMAQTMMACVEKPLMHLDTLISEKLRANPALTLDVAAAPPKLTLVTDAGDTLVFTGEPTAQTRFGGEPERVFMEVAAQTQPCNHPLIPNHQCLQVREIKFDENGLRVGEPGEWQPLYQDIEGYTHQPGVRNVLRLNRFQVKNPPADGSSIAYVLDMVVESETVKQ